MPDTRQLWPAALVMAGALLQGFTLGSLALLVTAATLCLAIVLVKRPAAAMPAAPATSGIDLAVLALGAWLLATVVVAAVPASAAIAVWQQCLFVVVYFAGVGHLADERAWRNLGKVLVILAIGLALWGFVDEVTSVRPGMRASFEQQNSLSGFLLLLIFALVPRLWRGTEASSVSTSRAVPVAVFLSLYVVFYSTSRAALGAWVVGFAGFALCRYLARRRGDFEPVKLLLALSLWAFLSADLSHQGGVFDSVRSVGLIGQQMLAGEDYLLFFDDAGDAQARMTAAKLASAHERFLIWRSVLEMVTVTPWYGFGPGSFRFAYPPFAAPADTTAGFYAHNDYAQFYIELGLPGLLIAGLIALLVAWRAWRNRRPRQAAPQRVIESDALAWGLLAVAAHSFFTYNFYVPATLVLAALVLARLRQLTPATLHLPRLHRAQVRPAIRVAVAVTIVGGPALTLGCAWMMAGAHTRGVTALENGDLEQAAGALRRAHAWYPNAQTDAARALVYVAAAKSSPDLARRTELLDAADDHIARAAERNPFAPEVPYARFLSARARYAGNQAELDRRLPRQLAATLLRNPRFSAVRAEMARYLRDTGRTRGAIIVMREGLAYAFPYDRRAFDYLALLRELYVLAQDVEGVARTDRAMRRMVRFAEVWG